MPNPWAAGNGCIYTYPLTGEICGVMRRGHKSMGHDYVAGLQESRCKDCGRYYYTRDGKVPPHGPDGHIGTPNHPCGFQTYISDLIVAQTTK